MKILSIESSADDTAIALIEVKSKKFKVIAHEKASQAKLHEKYGGIYPNLAKNEHIKNLPKLLEKILKKAQSKTSPPAPSPKERGVSPFGGGQEEVDLITVTSGPGLEPCLWAGVTFAEELAEKWNVPIVPVNHMEGHILSVFGKDGGSFKIPSLKFPVLSLLVSGGHTQLVITKKNFTHVIIGETLDDAVGEAFDKVARMLGLPYPGGPQISRLASQARKLKIKNSKLKIKFPRPMLKSDNFSFSYSGLKTSVLYLIKKIGKLNTKTKSEIAFEFERAAIEPLLYKTKKALEKYKAKTLIVAGGVAANKHLRSEIKKFFPKALFPTQKLAADNAIMIGIAGYLNYLENPKRKYKIRANGSLRLGEMIK